MLVANFIAYILCIIGALNWGLYGLFDFNLVSWIFQGPRTAGAITLYIIIAIAALWLIISRKSVGIEDDLSFFNEDEE